ncbi:MAG: TIGR02996 domain-containing protein [Archangium sp.]|nr:TIGR02996 domain-containing protein [Archangium sp.]
MASRKKAALEGLLQAVLEAPDADDARQVYADALIEAGDPRGEFIQLQLSLEGATPSAKATELRARALRLFAEHREAWMAPFGSMVLWAGWKRGMIDSVRAHASNLAGNPDALLAREPVTALELRRVSNAEATAFAKKKAFARVRTLSVAECGTSAATLLSGALPNLSELDLSEAGINDATWTKLAALLPQLTRLGLSHNALSERSIDALLGNRRLSKLESLGLAGVVRGVTGAARVARNLALPALRSLDLSHNDWNDADLRSLSKNGAFRKLTGLALRENPLTGAGAIDALAPLTNLEELDLASVELGANGAAALAKTFKKLRRLELMQCNVGAGAAHLAKRAWPLEVLDLQYCELDARACQALATADWPLRELNLWANSYGDKGLAALAKAPFTRTLRKLTLGYGEFGDAGVRALAAGNWPALEELVFQGDPIGESGAKALANSTTLPALVRIKFERNGAPKKALAPLRERGVELDLKRN